MFPNWRLQLREARVAWQNGRYDEAAALVTAEPLREFLPAKELAQDVAGKFVQRAADRFAHGDSLAGWQDLAKADRLGGQAQAIGELRSRYAQELTEEVQRYLLADQPAAALEGLQKLQKRGLADEQARLLQQMAQLVQHADRHAAAGHFAEAAAATQQAAALAKPRAALDATMNDIIARLTEQQARCESQAAECLRLSHEMHAALAAENWSSVLSAADALLAIAPQHVAAREARRRAWRAVGMDVTQPYTGRRAGRAVSLAVEKLVGRGRRSTHASRCSEDDTVVGKEHPQRALLWIDAVGGFLVCLDDSIVLGQPSPGDKVALPILADLSRRHAVIRRDAGTYVLEPLQQARVDGREITGPHVLTGNHLIELGDNVRLRFTKPHVLSATARLALESHHKTQPSADAVLLMAESCVLGPHAHCHVRCREWRHDVVIYRRDNQILCRADEPITIDGDPASGEVEIQSGNRIEGEEFAFTWETLM
jgi:hypothetical protein